MWVSIRAVKVLKIENCFLNKMTKITCNTQRMSVVTSSLMGIIFGCAIVYIVTRLVAVQRRVSYLEEHIVKKADEELVDILSSKIQTIQTSTQTMLSGLAQGIDNVINVPPAKSTPTPQSLTPHRFNRY